MQFVYLRRGKKLTLKKLMKIDSSSKKQSVFFDVTLGYFLVTNFSCHPFHPFPFINIRAT